MPEITAQAQAQSHAYTLLILWYPGTSLLRPHVVARLDTKTLDNE